MSQKIILLGAGGHAVSCIDTLITSGFEVSGIVSPNPPISPVLKNYPHYTNYENRTVNEARMFCLAIGHNYIRSKVAMEIISRFGESSLPPVCHPSAYISRSSRLQAGVVVMAKAVIGAYVEIGKGCLVNTSSSIDHECKIEDFSSLAPGACTGGNVKLGTRSAICLGAKVVHNIKIGDDAVIGASSLVLQDVCDCSVWYGIPARYIRDRRPSDAYM